jgi:hypothetical protein
VQLALVQLALVELALVELALVEPEQSSFVMHPACSQLVPVKTL